MGRSTVALTRCGDYGEKTVEAAMDRLVGLLGGLERFAGPGRRVFVKPNLLLSAAPERACTTHPQVLIALIRRLMALGATVSFGDLPGGFYSCDIDSIRKTTGMDAVEAATGAEFVPLHKHGFREAVIPGSRKLHSVHVPKYLDDIDVVINVCKLKTHMQTMMTCAVKNMFGMSTMQDRAVAHRNSRFKDFAQTVVDVYSVSRPALNIADAIVGMHGTGPSQGQPINLGYLLGSEDAVAMDAVAASALGFGPHEVLTTEIAAARGFGENDLRKITVVGDPVALVRKSVRRPSSAITMMMPMIASPFTELTKVRPLVDPKLCKACRKCEEICPADAISFKNKKAVVNDSRCLLCYCCHEICPFDAVGLKKPLLVKLAERINSI